MELANRYFEEYIEKMLSGLQEFVSIIYFTEFNNMRLCTISVHSGRPERF